VCEVCASKWLGCVWVTENYKSKNDTDIDYHNAANDRSINLLVVVSKLPLA